MSYPPQHGREGHYPTAPGPLFIQNKNDNDNRITQYPIYSNYGGSYGGSNGGYGGGYGSEVQSYGASLAPAQPQISPLLLAMLGDGGYNNDYAQSLVNGLGQSLSYLSNLSGQAIQKDSATITESTKDKK